MDQETRASAQARIATSAPKLTYGKHKNSLLPLNGIQFLHSNAVDTVNDQNRSAVSNAIIRATDQHSSDADDSPLSDAETVAREHNSTASSLRTKRVSVITTNKVKTRPHRFETGDVSDSHSSPEEEENASQLPKGARSNRERRTALPTQKKSKRKSVGIYRGRLPLNELVLVPDLSHQESFSKRSKRDRIALEADPISSLVQQILDLITSDDSETTRTNVPLSAIRKRLRTPSSRYKSLKAMRRKHHAAQITPTGSQLRQIVGDGFDQSELTPVTRSRYSTRKRKYQESPLPDLQSLSLAPGPLPDVIFTSSSQLDLEYNQKVLCDYTAQEPAKMATPSHGVDRLSSRRVEFSTSVVGCNVSAQLASVSAPRRERSVSLEYRSDDGDEGDDEGDDDDEADADVDEEEFAPEGDVPAPIETDHEMMESSPNASPERRGSSRNGSHLFRATPKSDRHLPGDYPPGFHRRSTPKRRLRLNEVNEPIDDNNPFDDMLLDNQHELNEIATGSVRMIEAPHLDTYNYSDINRVARRQSTQQRPPAQITRARSILKNSTSTSHVSSENTRPESTAANTRRNSTIKVEQSRYFDSAKDQLDTSLEAPVVIRKKSGSRFYAPIEVPYSDDMVPETSPRKVVNYTDTRQLHALKRTHDAVWTSSAMPVPETDLRSLTRSVSRNNGTLSQSVRRGSSMRF